MFPAKTIEAQMPEFWRDIFSSAQKLVDDYKSASSDPQVQEKVSFQKLPPESFIVVKTTVPAVTIKATPDLAAHRIEFVVIRRPRREADPMETRGRLRIVLDEAGELCAQTDQLLMGTPQQVAEFILIPLCKALSGAR
jgi:hypothetical protein